jgi:hypothetical protein
MLACTATRCLHVGLYGLIQIDSGNLRLTTRSIAWQVQILTSVEPFIYMKAFGRVELFVKGDQSTSS